MIHAAETPVLSEMALTPLPVSTDPLASARLSSSLVFVDSALTNLETLMQGLEASRVVLLDASIDGVDQITQTLAAYEDLDSIHIFSHGRVGELQLGNAQLSLRTLADYATALSQWGNALTAAGDLLFYGCSVAAEADGVTFVEQISSLTGADVAASSDLTGGLGDWDLEYSSDQIEATVALSAAGQLAYTGTLNLLSNGGFESGLGDWIPFSGSESVSSAAPFAGAASLQLQASGSGVGQVVSITAGETYALAGYGQSSADGYAGFGVNFFDVNWNYLTGVSQTVTTTNWTLQQMQGVAPVGSAHAQVWAYKEGSGGNFFLDNLTLDPVVTSPPPPTGDGPELLQNQGFEGGLESWIPFTGSESASSIQAFGGSRSLRLAAANSGAGQIIDVTANQAYKLTGYSKSSATDYVGLGLNFFDENFNYLDSASIEINGNTWQPYQIQTVAPANSRYGQLWAYKESSSGEVFVDQLSFKATGVNSGGTLPVITSNGGGANAALTLVEGTSLVTDVEATGSGLAYAVTGVDAAQFNIDPQTGVLAFRVAPDFEAPVDADRDNLYSLEVVVTNASGLSDRQTLSIAVTNAVSVYLLGGQSNMVGLGMNNQLPADLAAPYPAVQIWQLNTQSFTSLRPGFAGDSGEWGQFGPELTFGRGIDGFAEEEVYLIKYAVGSTSLAVDWNPAGANNVQYDTFISRVSSALAHLNGLGIAYTVEGMLWMQGEADAFVPEYAIAYEANLTALIADMRNRYNPELQFAIGRLHDPFAVTVRAAQVAIATADPLSYWVDTDNFEILPDQVHYSTAGQIDLGYGFANALQGG